MCMCSSRPPSLPMEPPILPLVKGRSTRWTEQSLPSIKRPPRLPHLKPYKDSLPSHIIARSSDIPHAFRLATEGCIQRPLTCNEMSGHNIIPAKKLPTSTQSHTIHVSPYFSSCPGLQFPSPPCLPL